MKNLFTAIKQSSLVHRFGQIIEKCLSREGGDPSLQQAGSQCRNGFPPSRERQRGRNDEQSQHGVNTLAITKRLSLFLALNLLLSPLFAAQPFETQHWQTTHGARVVFHQAMDVPMLDIGIVFAAGSAHDGNQFGLSALTTRLLDQGSNGLDAKAIADRLASTGAQYSATNTQDMIALSLRTLTNPKALKPAIDLFASIINQPNFSLTAFDHEKNLQLMNITKRKESPDVIGQETFYQALYQQHPYAHAVDGNYDTVNALTLKNIHQFYQRYFVSSNAVIVLVGAIDESTAHQLAEQITAQLPTGLPAAIIPEAKPLTEEMTIEVKYPSSQTLLRLGQLGIAHQDKHFFPLQVGNYILGGGTLESKLGEELRAKRGLTYGVNSQFLPMPGTGPFIISFATKKNQAKTAIDVTRQTLASFINTGPNSQELLAAKQYLTGSFPLSLASNRSIAEILLKIEFYHLPNDFLTTYTENINAVSCDDIKQAFQALIYRDKLLQITVGKTT